MDILNLDPNDDDEYAEDAEIEAELEEEELGIEAPKKPSIADRKSFKIGIAAAFIYTLVLIGDTVGALITLNGATPLEFGQGQVVTVPCDQNGITVSAQSSMDSTTVPYSFDLRSIKLSNISDDCINKEFKLTIYDHNGNKVNLGYKNISGASHENADFAKFIITRSASDSDGIDWRVFPATELPNPPTESGLTMCGGEYDLSDTIDYDWGTSIPKPGCPANNYLVHWRGYVLTSDSDDGQNHDVNFTINSRGGTLLQINNQTVITDRTSHGLSDVTGSFTLRYGKAYPLDLWMFKSTGPGHISLSWSRNGGEVVPSSAFQYDSSIGIQIAPTEGSTDYSTIISTWLPDQRSFSINFLRKMSTDNVFKFALESS